MVLVSDNSDETQELACARTFLAMRAAGVIITPGGSDAAALLAPTASTSSRSTAGWRTYRATRS